MEAKMRLTRIDLKDMEKLDEVFYLSDNSSNPLVRNFRKFFSTLKHWYKPENIFMYTLPNYDGFMCYTNGVKKNTLYEICIKETKKKMGLGKEMFQFYKEQSVGKRLRWRTHKDYDGFKFFSKLGYIPFSEDGDEFIYEVDN